MQVIREKPSQTLRRNHSSAAIQKVLFSMPSRAAGRRRVGIINRSPQLAQDLSDSTRTSIHGSGVLSDNEEDSGEGLTENKKEQLVNNLLSLSASDRVWKLRSMPLSLAEKTELRNLALSYHVGNSPFSIHVPCCGRFKIHIVKVFSPGKFMCLPFLSSLKLWQTTMKRLSGRFGTGVLSYFLFLRTLVCFNILLFLIIGLFLVIPQAAHPPPHSPTLHGHTGLELLTGTGYLSTSVMFYGYYTNSTINKRCGPTVSRTATKETTCHVVSDPQMIQYNIPLAYVCTMCTAFFLTCIILVYSLSMSSKSIRVLKSYTNLTTTVFCSWDFKVSKMAFVQHQSDNLSTQLKVQLSLRSLCCVFRPT